MNEPERILVVEIRTLDNPNFDSSQLSTLTVHRAEGMFYLDSIDTVKMAIVEGIVHLGSNYRHPLLFDVQVVPGDDVDTGNFDKPRRRRRRRRRSN